MTSLAVLVLGVLAVAGCAPAMYEAPVNGAAWGYKMRSSTEIVDNVLVYLPSKAQCQLDRTKGSYDIPRQQPWLNFSLGDCMPIRITPGAAETPKYWGYSLVSVTGYGMAFPMLEACELSRKGLKWPTTPSACTEITIQELKER